VHRGDDGARLFEGKVATDPAGLARLIRKRAPDLVRVGLESGATSAWLTHTLTAVAQHLNQRVANKVPFYGTSFATN
jgi:hypothetical protein